MAGVLDQVGTALSGMPCKVCGKAHVPTRERGYRAADGHAYAPREPNRHGLGIIDTATAHSRNSESTLRPIIKNKPDTAGFHTALFGGLFACDYCGAVVDHPDVPLHRGACHPKDAA